MTTGREVPAPPGTASAAARVAPGLTGPDPVDHAARRALLEFGFADPEVAGFERLPRGIKNLNYRVRAGGADWVLKCHQGPPGLAERRAATHLLELALAEAGLPTAPLRPPTSGGTFVTTEVGLFTLHGWVAGQQIPIAARDATHARHPEMAGGLGSLLGSMHRESQRVRAGGPAAIDARALLQGPRRAVRSIRHGPPHRFRKVSRLRLRHDKDDLDRWILAHVRDLCRDAVALAAPEVEALLDPRDRVLDHHDLNWENLVLDAGFEVVAVLDFDNAAVLPRELAVGAAAAVLVGADRVRLDDFLDAYADAAGAAPDPRAVNVGMHAKCLQSTLRSVDAYLSGRVSDTSMLGPWCRHLQACRLALPPLGERW